MKRFTLALLITLLFAWQTGITQYQVRDTASQTISVGLNAQTDSAQFIFPTFAGRTGANPVTDGLVAVNIKTNKAHASATTDSLTLTLRQVQKVSGSYVISRTAVITSVTYLDWDSGYVYTYPILDAFGPCHGLEVYVNYAGAGANDTMNAITWLTVQ